MKVQQFLEHHGIKENPFGQEDAQSDHVFKEFCLNGTHHPVWDKIFSNPTNPSTSVVFGEKGAGKTAIRMQMIAIAVPSDCSLTGGYGITWMPFSHSA